MTTDRQRLNEIAAQWWTPDGLSEEAPHQEILALRNRLFETLQGDIDRLEYQTTLTRREAIAWALRCSGGDCDTQLTLEATAICLSMPSHRSGSGEASSLNTDDAGNWISPRDVEDLLSSVTTKRTRAVRLIQIDQALRTGNEIEVVGTTSHAAGSRRR